MKKVEFGDFQTPENFTKDIVSFLSQKYKKPDVVIEPTSGLGNFIKSAYGIWKEEARYFGFEINNEYYNSSKNRFQKFKNIQIQKHDFFKFNWNEFISSYKKEKISFIGNPPWINNSTIGKLKGENLPKKTNFQQLKGLDAKTGSSNFDIAEWIIIELLNSINPSQLNYLAFLVKVSTARKVMKYIWSQKKRIYTSSIFLIDAKKVFGVSVEACLFLIEKQSDVKETKVYERIYENDYLYKFGMYKDKLVSNLDNYKKYNYLDGQSSYTWRSGLKHDASKVMEFTLKNGKLFNGFQEEVDIENIYLFPLFKSSDIANEKSIPIKLVLVPQKKPSEDTQQIKNIAPKTWAYLNKYSDKLQNRKSSIYKNKPPFSIFGIGDYSFSCWKVAVSGLHKRIKFKAIGCFQKKPIMLDDTSYFISCNSEKEANRIENFLNSKDVINFINSIVFLDAKRPVTANILNRIEINL
jgi:hypothetical protein